MTTVSAKQKSLDAEEEEKRTNMMSKLDMVAVLEAKEIYDSVMQAFPSTLGKSVSKKERDELNLKAPSLVYGEVTFETFGTVIEKIRKVYGLAGVGSSGNAGILQGRGGIFYDLGSGTGKPVIAAAILHNFDVCYGIEFLEGLYSVSLDALNSYNTKGKAKLASREHDTRKFIVCIVIFFCCTCYAALIELMKWTTYLYSANRRADDSRRLPQASYEGLERCRCSIC